VSCEKGRGISCSTPAGIFFSILWGGVLVLLTYLLHGAESFLRS
jgi:hypothetical protein